MKALSTLAVTFDALLSQPLQGSAWPKAMEFADHTAPVSIPPPHPAAVEPGWFRATLPASGPAIGGAARNEGHRQEGCVDIRRLAVGA